MRERIILVAAWAVILLPRVVIGQPQVPDQEAPAGRSVAHVFGYVDWSGGGHLFKDYSAPKPRGFGIALNSGAPGGASFELDISATPQFFGREQTSGKNGVIAVRGALLAWPGDSRSRLRPYLAFGVGLMRCRIREFAAVGWKDTKHMFFVDGGGGILLFLHRHIGVRGDARYVLPIGPSEKVPGWGMQSGTWDAWSFFRGSVGIAIPF